MSHWNHRVYNIKDQNAGEDLFVIREAYYDKDNKVIGSSDLKVMSETIDGLKWIAECIIKCLDKPILIPEGEKHPSDIVNEIIELLNHSTIKNGCDLSDIGNEIGIAIGKYINEDKLGYELESFIAGIRHGISLVDGTH